MTRSPFPPSNPYNLGSEPKEVFMFGRWVSVREAKAILGVVQTPLPGSKQAPTYGSGDWTCAGYTCGTCGGTCGGTTCGSTTCSTANYCG